MIIGILLGSITTIILQFILSMIIIKKYGRKERISDNEISGLRRSVNIFDDKANNRVFLSSDDWVVISEALNKYCNTEEIDCTPTNNRIN